MSRQPARFGVIAAEAATKHVIGFPEKPVAFRHFSHLMTGLA
jgi:dTDP-glucose pyrophosphorylase